MLAAAESSREDVHSLKGSSAIARGPGGQCHVRPPTFTHEFDFNMHPNFGKSNFAVK
jgi:hypothetical protein